MGTVEAGTEIAGRYALRQVIGSGGMAVVHLALDRRLGREVAVKLLHPGLASDPAFVERFRREAQNAAALNHPNIVSVYDWGNEGGTYYLVMEHVAGSTLKDVILRRGRRPEREALEICAEVAAALEAAHAHGVVHRDVKPQNVLLDTEGGVKVGDFGIARATGESELTATGTVLGSAHYASPEQIERRPVDARSDLYSLGAVLYELLTGHAPFVADTPLAIAWQHVHEAPEPPSAHAPGLSAAAERIVLKALQKDPERRHQTAGELIAGLRAALDGRPVAAPVTVRANVRDVHEAATIPLRPIAPRQPAVRERERGRLPALTLVVVALLLVPLGLLALRSRQAVHEAGPAVVGPPLATASGTIAAEPAGAAGVAGVSATAAPSPPPTVPPTAPAPTVTRSEAQATSPAAAIGSFYAAAAGGRFAEAAALWSPRMKGEYPPAEFIDGRFAQTHSLTVNAARVIEQTVDRAVVAVDLTEVIGSPPETRRWTGTWTLVRSGSEWLLDAPNLTRS